MSPIKPHNHNFLNYPLKQEIRKLKTRKYMKSMAENRDVHGLQFPSFSSFSNKIEECKEQSIVNLNLSQVWNRNSVEHLNGLNSMTVNQDSAQNSARGLSLIGS